MSVLSSAISVKH